MLHPGNFIKSANEAHTRLESNKNRVSNGHFQ